MPADLDRLRQVLAHELDSGCGNRAVEGGLDELLRLQARGEPFGSPLLRMIAALPDTGYATLEAEARQTWVRRALATIARERDGVALPPSPPARRSGSGQSRPDQSRPGRSRSTRAARIAPRSETPVTTPTEAAGRSTAAARKIAPGAAGLDLPLRQAGTGLRPGTIEKIERLGITTVGDALRTYPYRHHDFSRIVPVAALRPGIEQTVQGTVDEAREVRMGRGGRMRATELQLSDDAGSRIRVIWFNQPYLVKQFRRGLQVAVSGTVRDWRGRPSFDNPEWEMLDGGDGTHTGRMVPVYHLTQGLAQRQIRTMMAGLLDRFADRLPDPLPAELRTRHGLLGIVEATRQVHYPDNAAQLAEARRRLAFEELLAVQLGVVSRKRAWTAHGDAAIVDRRDIAESFIRTLPYRLTGAQRRALDDILGDLTRPSPMGRLLEGDVGSGKTVVALAAMLATVGSGYQASLMAPTEVLAEQHFRTICQLLSGEPAPPLHGFVPLPFLGRPLRVVLLTGSTRAKERKSAMEAIRFGGADLVVGTHALIQENVDFYRLGLSIVDEQHRFGVMQRSALREKGSQAALAVTPHLLVMSATPIPRSLALTAYGDLDLSIIDELPPGRTPIETQWLPPERRHDAFTRIRSEVVAGRQAFVICPLVEGSEAVASRAATEEYERLRAEEFPDLADRIALLHGRMNAREKDTIMSAFGRHEYDILVSTSVIEVGIDVPNATVMVIEGADRFGLAQLHQFRGRVGRGPHASICYLLADDPTPEAEERLSTVARTPDGFALAQADLELRGPGELFGTRQSGEASLRVASLLDVRLIEAARREAEQLLDRDPDLTSPDHRALRHLAARLAGEVVAEMH